MAKKPAAAGFSVGAIVAGQEKFLIMILGAVAVYVQATTYIDDQNLKNLITAVIVAAQGWLGTNSGSVQLEAGEVVADKSDVDPGAETKPPRRVLTDAEPNPLRPPQPAMVETTI